MPEVFKSLIQNLEVKCSVNFSRIMAHKNTRVFSYDKVENKLFRASVFWMNDSRIHRNMKIAWDDSAAKLGPMTDVTFHSTHLKGYQSKLLFFLCGLCSFWGLLHCDDRRSPWWASRDGPHHDHIRSDTVMISMNFNSYASLVIFFIISVFFCFVFEHKTLYTTRVLAVFDIYYRT